MLKTKSVSDKSVIQRYSGIKKAAEILGVSISTARSWADSGKIPCIRDADGERRFPIDKLRAYRQ